MLSFSSFLNLRNLFVEEKSKGLYVAAYPDRPSVESIKSLVRAYDLYGLGVTEDEELHCTLVYSRAPLLEEKLYLKKVEAILPAYAKGVGFTVFKQRQGGSCLVLELETLALTTAHVISMTQHRARYDFPHYRPHVTLVTGLPDDYIAPEFVGDVELNFSRIQAKPLEDT